VAGLTRVEGGFIELIELVRRYAAGQRRLARSELLRVCGRAKTGCGEVGRLIVGMPGARAAQVSAFEEALATQMVWFADCVA